MSGTREAVQQKIRALEDEIRALKRAEKINQTLFGIASAVNTTPNLEDLYASIHRSLNRLMPVPNFFISLYDRQQQVLLFPFYRDEVDTDPFDDIVLFQENSLTGEVILSKQPLFLDRAGLEKRKQENRVLGSLPQVWLGVPLISGGTVIGVMAVQHYTDPEAYTEKDLSMMGVVSNQVAIAIERKRFQETLMESEERFRTLAEKSHDIIMRFDAKGRHLYVNPAICRLKMTPGQMVGKTHRELGFDPGLVEKWEKAIALVFRTRLVNRIEFKLPGGPWFDWMLCPEFNADQAVSSVITFARDITKQKQEEHANACLDRINQIIIGASDIDDMFNRILDTLVEFMASDRAWILFPCDPDAAAYRLPYMRCRDEWFMEPGMEITMTPELRELRAAVSASRDPVYRVGTQSRLARYLKEKYHIESQISMAVRPNQGPAWEVGLHQCSHARKWSHEERQLFQSVCQRIRDGLSNMLLYRQLLKAENQLTDVLDSMPSVLMAVDSTGLVTRWNRHAATHMPREAAMGHLFYELLPHLARFKDTILTAVIREKSIETNRIQRQVDGRTVHESVTVYPLTGGDVRGAVIRIDDITEQVLIEEMVIQSEKMLSVGGLAAGMAHEINNPLAGMMQNAQVIQNRLVRDLPDNRAAAENSGIRLSDIRSYVQARGLPDLFDHIQSAGLHAADIIKNMLSFSRKGEGQYTRENLPELMARTLGLVKNAFKLERQVDFQKIRFRQTVSEDFPKIRCESAKIQQVFLNILKNGAEAMCGNPADVAPAFHIRFFRTGTTAVVKITDTGPGMTREMQHRIFEPFFTTKSPGEGTGLGLSVSYFIIKEDHKGDLRVSSEKGKGTTFTISLPIHG